MPNIFNQPTILEQAFSRYMSTPYEDWKTNAINLVNSVNNGITSANEYTAPQGSELVDNYNINKSPRWSRASYDILSEVDPYSFLSDLHSQGNTLASEALSKKIWDAKHNQFIQEAPDRMKELQKKYLESDLTWSDADTARDWYAVGATPEELKTWDENSRLATKLGLGTIAGIYASPFVFSKLRNAGRFLNLKTAKTLRNWGWNKTARALSDYGLTNAALDLGFTGNLAANVAKGDASTKDLMLDLGITGAIIGRKPIVKGLRWIGSKIKSVSPILLSPILLSGSAPIKDDKTSE